MKGQEEKEKPEDKRARKRKKGWQMKGQEEKERPEDVGPGRQREAK